MILIKYRYITFHQMQDSIISIEYIVDTYTILKVERLLMPKSQKKKLEYTNFPN